jgi:hypothetical protein
MRCESSESGNGIVVPDIENRQRAMARLKVVVPLSIALIALLLYASLQSWTLAALVLANLRSRRLVESRRSGCAGSTCRCPPPSASLRSSGWRC